MSNADPTARMIEFRTGDELEEFAAKAQIVAFPTGVDDRGRTTPPDFGTRHSRSTRSSINTAFGEADHLRSDHPPHLRQPSVDTMEPSNDLGWRYADDPGVGADDTANVMTLTDGRRVETRAQLDAFLAEVDDARRHRP